MVVHLILAPPPPHLQLPHLILKADGNTNGDLQPAKSMRLLMLASYLHMVKSMQLLMILHSYLHLPHFLLKVHQLVLKASSDADGDLRMENIIIDCFKQEKRFYRAPAGPSLAPVTPSLGPEDPSPGDCRLISW